MLMKSLIFMRVLAAPAVAAGPESAGGAALSARPVETELALLDVAKLLHTRKDEVLQRFPLAVPVSDDQVAIRWVGRPRIDGPTFGPVAVSSQNGPKTEPRSVAVAIRVGVNGKELREHSACDRHGVEQFFFRTHLGVWQRASGIKSRRALVYVGG